tara:strand:- start:486 stop:788 length:303 start_codon:yes stop_codon:yes gene_type:complete
MTKFLIILLFLFGCTGTERVRITQRYESGNPRTEMTTKNGHIQLMRVFFENGDVQAVQNYKDGKLHGKSIVYDIDGNILLEKFYENGIEGKNVEIFSPRG